MYFVRTCAEKLKLTNRLKSTIKVMVFMALACAIGLSQPASAETYSISAQKTAFEPAQVEVQPGDKIHFEVQQAPPHNVVFEARGDRDLSQFTHTDFIMSGGFDITIPANTEPGTYQYWCFPHRNSGMSGKILIKG